ncbi:MAG: PDZ domain-containing protein, partial [Oscillospiraceae bacterium]|nr:PDZ domain-containing protein [Oscillospiraceae bacterium]
MNRKLSVGVSVALIFVAITITFTVTMIFSMRLFDEKVLNVKERAAMYNKLSEIDNIVRSNLYFDIDEQRLYDAISKGYIDGLADRDSVYLSAAQIQRRGEAMKGMEVTIGFETERNAGGYITVANLRKGSSAAELGLLESDVIVRIDGKDVLEHGYEETVSLLKGAAGTKVEVTYSRDGEETAIEVTRELIETTAVYFSREIAGVGYIRFKLFNDNTESQFSSALNTLLSSQEVKGLIFDLRDVSGGYNIEAVAYMLGRLVPTGVIISGTYADGVTKTLY